MKDNVRKSKCIGDDIKFLLRRFFNDESYGVKKLIVLSGIITSNIYKFRLFKWRPIQ